jgi:flagellar biosynthesis protein FlhF
MIVKKFQAPTEMEAIIKAREELGSTAVVLNIKSMPGEDNPQPDNDGNQ